MPHRTRLIVIDCTNHGLVAGNASPQHVWRNVTREAPLLTSLSEMEGQVIMEYASPMDTRRVNEINAILWSSQLLRARTETDR